MLPPESAATSGAPRPVPPEGLALVGVSPKAVWYQGVGFVVSTPPSPAPAPPPVHDDSCNSYLFQTASRKVASVASAPDTVLGSTVRPPATSCQRVARSFAAAEP